MYGPCVSRARVGAGVRGFEFAYPRPRKLSGGFLPSAYRLRGHFAYKTNPRFVTISVAVKKNSMLLLVLLVSISFVRNNIFVLGCLGMTRCLTDSQYAIYSGLRAHISVRHECYIVKI